MNNNERNIWIFGGTGFIGSSLIEHLSFDSHNRLHLLLHHHQNHKKLESFNTFIGSVEHFDFQLFKRYPPDVIFHLARFAGGRTLTRKLASKRAYKANQRLVGMITKLEKLPIVVYVSGSLMYGSQSNGNLATEHTKLSPVAYAKYYIRGELPWIKAQEDGLIDIRFARPGWIVGPSSWFLEFYWKYYLKSGKIPSYGDGEQFMSLIGLQDCVSLIDMLSREVEVRKNLNIFTGSPVKQKDFSATIAKMLNTEVVEVPVKELSSKYGKTVTSALTASIPISTVYPEMYRNFEAICPDMESIIERTLRLLKNK